ncbi:hypothetical protein ABZ599_39770 [Streptomyces misionensis]|uniref:MmyB family transcriptional regulator n=1 Tax=Streptomyces misionensis TaxID=67331 RepID=UPI0033F36684
MDWDKAANDIVVLCGDVGANRLDRRLSNPVGELTSRSHEFTQRWAVYHVKYHRTGCKALRYRAVGGLDLGFETLALPATSSLSFLAYYPVDDVARERLRLLENWAATKQRDGRSEDLLGQT